MPPFAPNSDSSDDEDAPEAVSLSQSKKTAEERSDAFQKHQTELRKQKRLQNQEKDRRLKEQASKRKEKLATNSLAAGSSESESEELEHEPDHLPDHLFAEAFQAPPKSKASLAQSKKKKKRPKTSPKDVVMGSRIIRVRPSADNRVISAAPSAKIQKFLDRSLSLKTSGSRTRGWERRAANIGVLKSSGPPANFVRKWQ